MRPLFNRIYDGAYEMFEYAEMSLNVTINELGEEEPVKMPGTDYNCACIYAVTGKKIANLKELKEALQVAKSLITYEKRTKAAFNNGVAAVLCGEVMEVCKYVKNTDPYKNTIYHGHFTDAEIGALKDPLLKGEIPGFAVIIDEAPSDQAAADLIKEYRSKGIFVFLIGDIIDQAERARVPMGLSEFTVPVCQDVWGVAHIISLVVRVAMILGGIKPGDPDALLEYTYYNINAFVNAFKPVHDITVAYGAGAIAMGFPVITNDSADMWPIPKTLLIQENFDEMAATSLEARGLIDPEEEETSKAEEENEAAPEAAMKPEE